MFKKLFQGALVGAAMLGLVGAASAATVEVNLYGASAQFLFWNDAADNFLSSKSCTGITQDQYNSAHGITRGTCSGDTVYIRYSSKASYDGIYAVKGSANTDSCPNAYQRKMVDEGTCPWDGTGGSNCTALKCVEVVLGCSDVAGETFTQSSSGQLKGPAGGGATSRSFSGISTTGLDFYNPLVVPFGFFANNSVTVTKCLAPDPTEPAGASVHKAISSWGNQCVPDQNGNSANCIGYYKCQGLVPSRCDYNNLFNSNEPACLDGGKCSTNNPAHNTQALCEAASGTWQLPSCSNPTYTTKATCEANAGTWTAVNVWVASISAKCNGGVNANQNCTRDNQCPDVALGNTSCKAIPIDNISRLMATMIYNGQAYTWKDFGDWYPSLPIVACLRHAGSGTAATLDYAVMKGNGWGWGLVTAENASSPTIWFNDGSSDEMNCVNTLSGAIGYADADQIAGSVYYPNVHALKYQGVEPKRWKIRNGEYDFWSLQWIYGNPARTAYSSIKTGWIVPLVNFAADPANVPSTKAEYWATDAEMVYMKSTDQSYPGYRGASLPQLP
jgi:hypothetical protein